MAGIFISYRRQESQSAAGRLADHLRDHLRTVSIFRDVETIEPGVDFVLAIDKALTSCAVMLVVIGPRWLTVTDTAGRRRLDDPGDYTRLEVATALKREQVRVIPVLAEGAAMPSADDLPDDLKPLARRNAIELTDKRWEYDVSQLVETLRHALRAARRADRTQSRAGISAPPPEIRHVPGPLGRGGGCGKHRPVRGVSPERRGPLVPDQAAPPVPTPAGSPADLLEPRIDAEVRELQRQLAGRQDAALPATPQYGVDLTGTWRDTLGGEHRIHQRDGQIAVQGLSTDGVVVGMGGCRAVICGSSTQWAATP